MALTAWVVYYVYHVLVKLLEKKKHTDPVKSVFVAFHKSHFVVMCSDITNLMRKVCKALTRYVQHKTGNVGITQN